MKGIKLRPADVKPKANIEDFVDDNEEDNSKNHENEENKENGEASYA